MGVQIPITQTFQLPDGREVIMETGKLAAQAHGSAMIRLGDTMLLATVVSNKEAKEGQPFFPLSVDYQEKFASVGRVPGNFFRRETRVSSCLMPWLLWQHPQHCQCQIFHGTGLSQK